MSSRNYKVYKITCPENKNYIGLTRTTILARWYGHISRSNRSELKDTLLGKAIKQHGKKFFNISMIEDNLTKKEGQEREKFYIAYYKTTDRNFGYNVLSGNIDDTPGAFFWKNINKNVDALMLYKKRLSDACKKESHMKRMATLTKEAEKWRTENPDKVTHNAKKASQANIDKLMSDPVKAAKIIANRQRIAGRIKRNNKKAISALSSDYVTKIWATRTLEERKRIGDKISQTLKVKNANKSEIEKETQNKQLANARQNVNKNKWKERIKEGRILYWSKEKQKIENIQ